MSIDERDVLLSSYDFDLPEGQIAQHPTADRAASRLLHLDRRTGAVHHHAFRDLVQLLTPGDLLVLNNTRVIPARLRGRRLTGGRLELLLLRRGPPAEPKVGHYAERWEALVKPAARLRVDVPVELGSSLVAWPERREGEHWVLRLEADQPVLRVIEEVGEVPLPPYIVRESDARRLPEDLERYQTVYARHSGSAAAPTAGLHFSAEMLEALRARGVEIHLLTLHVGAGTFSPVRCEDIRAHRMHAERFSIPGSTWRAITEAKSGGRRVIAVGTTSVRTLETIAAVQAGVSDAGTLRTDSGDDVIEGETSIFIHPGFAFRVVDGLITNFHLPRSSLIMLVSAFAGREQIMSAYRSAVESGYRFFSYGDAMLIV